MKILKYFPANGRSSTQGFTDQNQMILKFRTESNQDQSGLVKSDPISPWIPGSLVIVRRQTGFSRLADSSIGNDDNEGLNLLF